MSAQPIPVSIPARSRRPSIHVAGRVQHRVAIAVLAALLFFVALFAVAVGAFPISVSQVIAILFAQIGVDNGTLFEPQQAAVLLSIRLPRVLLGLVAGGALAIAGAALQGLFRNPLADPSLIGVSGGAAVAVASVIVLGATSLKGLSQSLGSFTLPMAGFIGGMAATFLVHALARHEGRTSLITMLLGGIAVNAVAFAMIGLFSLIANDEQLRNITFWSFGSLGGATWQMLAALVLPLLVAYVVLARIAPGLNALAMGEREAAHIGYDVQRLKTGIIVLAALCTGCVVATCGLIGFVALVAPHIARMLCGPDNRTVVPISALLGATLMVSADVIARIVIAPAELPIGVVTALLGAPFFLFLLIKQRRHWMT